MENVTITPTIYKHRADSRGMVKIVLAIYLNRKAIAYDDLHKKIHIDAWDQERKEVIKDGELNALIRKRCGELDKEFTRQQLEGNRLTKELIRKIIKGEEHGGSFFTYAAGLIENKKLKDGQGYSQDTKRRYGDEMLRLRSFSPELLFCDLTQEFVIRYRTWMQTTYKKKDGKRMHKNSIWKALSFVRMICNEAISDGNMKEADYPFKKLDIGKCETDPSKIKYLELDQVEAIERALTEKRHLLQDMTIKVGWRFLSMCVLGMRISDAMKLDDAFINDAGNLDFIPHKTRRSGNVAQVPIVSDRQRRYLEKTFSLPLPDRDAKTFRTEFNDHLKILAVAAGISMHITSHVGRHTMGSFMVDANINEQAAMKMLGVKSNNTIKIYSHLKQSKLLSEANKLNNIF